MSNSLQPDGLTAACQASFLFTVPWSLLGFMSIELVMLSNHLLLCCPLLLPSVFPSKLAVCIRWPKYWSFSISPSNECSGLISFTVDWFELAYAKWYTYKHLRRTVALSTTRKAQKGLKRRVALVWLQITTLVSDKSWIFLPLFPILSLPTSTILYNWCLFLGLRKLICQLTSTSPFFGHRIKLMLFQP